MHTSALQSRWFSSYARQLTWDVRNGACDRPMQAPPGPYDARLGYSRLDSLQAKLTARDFRIARQACPSVELEKLVAHGIAPPYTEKQTGTLELLDREGKDLYRAPLDQFAFTDFAAVPRLLVQSLLYVENRQLLAADRPSVNPAVEWDRLFFASTNYAIDKVVETGSVQGGSTLATQLEKFRHSPEGRTSSGADKARQIFAASLRAYRNGPDTRAARHEILLDYLNSMPLGAAPGEGEVTGLGHGMQAWFDKTTQDLAHDLALPEDDAELPRKAETYKQALALVMATRRPTAYLSGNHAPLEDRIRSYLPLMVQDSILSPRLAEATLRAPLRFREDARPRRRSAFVDSKATNAVRTELLDLLGVKDLYTLDRYDLRVETSIDSRAQEGVTSVLRQFANPDYMARHGFYGKHLLSPGDDPSKLLYSFSLYEVCPEGNRLRVSADNLEEWLDINRDVKLEMGSTAKLRTMANYLMVVAGLWEGCLEAPPEALRRDEFDGLDTITRWMAGYLRRHPGASLDQVLEASLLRTFSTDTSEGFRTGSGLHYFRNFDDEVKGPTTLGIGFQHSVNLVYIRLMRELVHYYTGAMGYDTRKIYGQAGNPQRKELLDAATDSEARTTLHRFYRRYENIKFETALAVLCGKDAKSLRRLAIFALAENPNATLADLRALARRIYPQAPAQTDEQLRSYQRSYARRIRNLQDEAYLLGEGSQPLEIWVLRDLRDHPGTSWPEVLARSPEARREASRWIYSKRFKKAQDLQIGDELERRSFGRILVAWKSLGYSFDHLVPSLATAIGSSADRPQSLAELVGIIQRGGVRAPLLRVDALHFGEGTPYETHFEPAGGPSKRVMPVEVAEALEGLMHTVVEGGTAVRVRDALHDRAGKPIPIGGKTGSGDNRYERVDSHANVVASRAINRTASFVFVIGERFFGMVTAFVNGEEAGTYRFTSSLALQAFRVLAEPVEPLVQEGESGALHATAPAAPEPVAAAPAPSPRAGLSAPAVAIAKRP